MRTEAVLAIHSEPEVLELCADLVVDAYDHKIGVAKQPSLRFMKR